MIFNYFTYRDEAAGCTACGWQGKGREMPIGWISEEHWLWDLNCPRCHEAIGCAQAPLLTEVETWRKAHPGWVDG